MLFERFDTKNRKGFIKNLIKYFYFLSKVHLDHPELYSGVDIFWVILGNSELREPQTAGTITRGGATKKREISLTSLPINLHF